VVMFLSSMLCHQGRAGVEARTEFTCYIRDLIVWERNRPNEIKSEKVSIHSFIKIPSEISKLSRL
jgi:hypothetical protein